jgi:TfoX/Sxy family transcriptional regulator of competence genes
MRVTMSYDEAVVDRVRRVLSRRRGVVEKRMVGGVSFMVRGAMCCGVTGDRLMVRVGAGTRGRMLAKPHTEPMKFAGRSLAGFICVAPAGYRTDRALTIWVQRGIDFAATLPRKRR